MSLTELIRDKEGHLRNNDLPSRPRVIAKRLGESIEVLIETTTKELRFGEWQTRKVTSGYRNAEEELSKNCPRGANAYLWSKKKRTETSEHPGYSGGYYDDGMPATRTVSVYRVAQYYRVL